MLPERILMTLLLGGVAIGCVFVLYPFFSAILWAAILTYTTWPMFEWCRQKLGLSNFGAAAVMVLVVAVVVVLPMGLAVPTSASDVDQISKTVNEALPVSYTHLTLPTILRV